MDPRVEPAPVPPSVPATGGALVDEQQVRVAAGITMALGAVAFVYANFDRLFWPIRTVSILLAVDFAVRVVADLDRSPIGLIARAWTRRRPPKWVSLAPKRFAWTLGLGMATTMAVVTNCGIHGPLPRTVCLTCLTLMWLESVLGLCLGCQLHRLAISRGWRRPRPGEICADGVCEVERR
jgi:hypothetical protein